MAITVGTIPAPPERIFGVLADPYSYEKWVVGSDTIRDADDTWPAAGSRFHHRVGFGPFKVNDDTKVVESEPPRRLVLRARSRPFGTAKVEFDLQPEGRATRVRIVEEPGDLLSRIFHNPLMDRVMEKRNVETLRRLGRLATEKR